MKSTHPLHVEPEPPPEGRPSSVLFHLDMEFEFEFKQELFLHGNQDAPSPTTAICATPPLLLRKELQSNFDMLHQTIYHFNRFAEAKVALTTTRCVREACVRKE